MHFTPPHFSPAYGGWGKMTPSSARGKTFPQPTAVGEK